MQGAEVASFITRASGASHNASICETDPQSRPWLGDQSCGILLSPASISCRRSRRLAIVTVRFIALTRPFNPFLRRGKRAGVTFDADELHAQLHGRDPRRP